MAYEKSLDWTKLLSGSSLNTTSVLGSTVDLMAARMLVPENWEKEISKGRFFLINLKSE